MGQEAGGKSRDRMQTFELLLLLFECIVLVTG